MMNAVSIILLLIGVCIVEECHGVVWESQDTSSSPRGRGQVSPIGYDLDPQDLKEQLKDIGRNIKTNNAQNRGKRQTDEEVLNLSTTAILSNDSHFHALVHWTGFPHENIFILTRQLVGGISRESWLWRSTDYGQSFVNETETFNNNSVIQLFYISANTSNLIFTDVINKQLHLTKDTGESYTVIDLPFTPNRLLFQNRFSPGNIAYYDLVLGYDNDQESLWASMDIGQSWTQIGTNVPFGRYFWRRLDASIEGDLTTVYFEQRTANGSSESMLYTSSLPYTETQLFNPQLGTFQSDSFVLEQEYMFIEKPWLTIDSNLTHSSSLLVSYRRDPVFRQAMFPLFAMDLDHLHFSIVDASEGFVFMAVYHNVNSTHLYISDVGGTQYVLSLEHIANSPVSAWINDRPSFDVHVAEGLVGVVLANQKIPGREFSSTLISRNKGGSWGPLTPPTLDRNQRPTLCVPPGCSLHLRMETDVASGYQSILSQETAVGLVMAAGNTGSNLAPVNRVYMSRDGGFTWVELQQGRWEYQFLALGSIIVMVRKQFLIDEFMWTCDEGETWQTGVLEDAARPRIAVIGMKTEIGEKPRIVSVFGLDYYVYITNDFEFEWIVFTLNFTSVVNRQCETVDYFDWMPSDGRQQQEGCLLGEVVTYERRNSSLCCYVDPDYQKPTDRFTCTCSLEDFECDFGFQRESLSGPCVPAPGFIYPPKAPVYCPEEQNYTYTSGYRKIPGDQCEDLDLGDLYLPKTGVCPVRIARRLSISYTPSNAQPGVPITLTLSQQEGSSVSTMYIWSFNDSSPTAEATGLLNARTQQHTFPMPGVYYVSVTTVNQAGSDTTTLPVTVLDTLTGFTVNYPSEIASDSLPTGFYFEFSVNVLTQYNTQVLSVAPFMIYWDFGDSTVISSPSTMTGHIYTTVGNYTITGSINAVLSNVETVITRNIRTYVATRTVSIVGDSLITKGGKFYARVGRPILYTASPEEDKEIAPDTSYTWKLNPESKYVRILGNDAVMNYSFPSWGEQDIAVIGDYISSRATFYGRIIINAQNELRVLTTLSKRAFKVGALISIILSPFDVYGKPYTGPISIIATSNSGRLATHSSSLTDTSEVSMSFIVKEKGSSEIQLLARNDISEVTANLAVAVVDAGEYGDVTLVFTTGQLPSSDEEYMDKITDAIVRYTIEKYAPNSVVQIDGREFISSRSRKRQSSPMYLAVYLNILPSEHSEEAIQSALETATLIVSDVKSGKYELTVDGEKIKADQAFDRSSNEPFKILDPKNPLVDIIIAVVFVIVLIALGIGFVVVVVICRKRYNTLQSKYSHLDETAGGNLTFNDTFADQDSGDTKPPASKEMH